MEPEDLERFITDYFDEYDRLVRERTLDRAEQLWAQAEAAAREEPDVIDRFEAMDLETAWRTVVALVERAPSEEAMLFVAAGPLEDLIRRRATWVGPRALDRARADPRFRRALGGVWGLERLHEPLRSEVLRLVGAGEPESCKSREGSAASGDHGVRPDRGAPRRAR